MSRIAFVTDSTCNMPDELVRQHNITVVPVYVIFGDTSYKDYVEMPPAEFYSRLSEYKAAGKGMPTTSQPTPEDFRAAYAALAEKDYADIISIHVTAKSSGACQSAQLASGMVDGNIPDKANEWAARAARSLNFDGQPVVVDFGPALAVHFGPGLLGVAVQWE